MLMSWVSVAVRVSEDECTDEQCCAQWLSMRTGHTHSALGGHHQRHSPTRCLLMAVITLISSHYTTPTPLSPTQNNELAHGPHSCPPLPHSVPPSASPSVVDNDARERNPVACLLIVWWAPPVPSRPVSLVVWPSDQRCWLSVCHLCTVVTSRT